MNKKSSNHNQRLLITQQEMILIKNSNEATNFELYGNLYDCVEKYKKLSKTDLDNNFVFDKKAKTVLLNAENKKMMMNKILDEWYSIKNCEIVQTLVNCQLCGRPNKYVFFIRNKITEADLHIGSDCVKNFPDITGIKQQKKRLSQLQREQAQQKRKIEFEVCEGDEVDFIENAENKFKEFPVVLPFDFSVWEMVSKGNGIFCVDTLKKVYDERYVDKKIREIISHLKDEDLRILQISKSYIHFSIKNERYVYPVTFIISLKNFMENVGCYALTDQYYQFGKEDLNDIVIEETSNNFYAGYNSILDLLKRNGYDFIVEDKTAQAYWKKLSRYERRNKWNNRVYLTNPMYKKSNISLFLKTLSLFLLKDETYLEENFGTFVKLMENGKVWITQKEKNDYEEAARYARGMQKQKGFIPY